METINETKYELTILAKVGTELDNLHNLIVAIEKTGVRVIKSQNEGVKELAYPIEEFTEAHYYFFNLKGLKPRAKKLSKMLSNSDDILRYMLVTRNNK